MSTFYIHTLGCPKNTVDSDELKKRLFVEGFTPCSNIKQADIVLVNTCGFIQAAKEESIEEILTIAENRTPGQKLVVFGCLAKRYLNELKKELPEVDAFFGVEDFENITSYCKQFLNGNTTAEKQHYSERVSESHAYIKIAEGCNRRCSFCAIPSIRGPLRSSKPEDILKRAEELVIAGIKELILIAQDITSYGKDLSGYNLSRLLYDLNSISGDFWIRLLYLFPDSIDEHLIQAIKENRKVCHYIDLPLQHSEDPILRLMKRPGTKEQILQIIEIIRKEIPDVVLRTSFIVGFPSEGEEEFERLLEFVKDVGFERLGAFTYSREEGTPAYDFAEQVPDEIKQERYHRLMTLQAEISYRKNLELVGKKLKVLIDDIENRIAYGRYYGQAPEIDGLTIIKNPGEKLKKGEFINVIVTEAHDYDLEAEVVQ